METFINLMHLSRVMTIVIGIKAKDGVILASDCQLTRGLDKIPVAKIHQSLYQPENGSIENPHLTGIYYGSSGSHAFLDLGLVAKDVFARASNVADLLTDDFILHNSLTQINEYLDSLSEQSRNILRRSGKGETYRDARKQEERMTQYRDVKSFIESGNSGAVSSLSRVVLRLSDNYHPDIVHVRDSQVKPVRYIAMGDGKQLVDEELSRRYSESATVHDALTLVIDAMNTALEHREKYTGYQLVMVTRLNNEKDIIRTAQDTKSHKINLGELNYLDPWFESVNR